MQPQQRIAGKTVATSWSIINQYENMTSQQSFEFSNLAPNSRLALHYLATLVSQANTYLLFSFAFFPLDVSAHSQKDR